MLVRVAVLALLTPPNITTVSAAENLAQVQRPITIAAGDLRAALEALVRLTGLQLLYNANAIDGLQTKGVSAAASPQEALTQLLLGTSLITTVDSSGAILIVAPSESQIFELEEVTVTGTHIRGVADLPMPAVTLTRRDFARSGHSEVADVLRSLPQNLGDFGREHGGGAGISEIASANVERASAVNLRGLGPQSTLVLLNGQRRAGSVGGRVVDLSAIPLSVIERVEVVTGGRSAVYGSDAVAGVVNIVTRRDFEGAESRVYYGGANAGAAQLGLSQVYGRRVERGGFIVSYDYSDQGRLDATDAGIVDSPSATGIVVTPGQYDLQPAGTRHAGFVSGAFEPNERTEIYADALYTSSRNRVGFSYSIPTAGFDFSTSQATDSDQYSIAPGVRFDLNEGWRLDIATNYGKSAQDSRNVDNFGSHRQSTESSLASVSVVVDGAVLSNRVVEFKAAIGAEGRREGLQSASDESALVDDARNIHSAFGEALVSLGPEGMNGQRPVQLSAAARYSDYSDFGSSVDPQFGIVWHAGASWSLRGAYSSAFRAPDLYSMSSSFGQLATLRYQSNSTAPGDVLPVMILSGNNPDLEPEEAESWSFGVDYAPAFAPELRLSLSYFDIRYDKRIEPPAEGAEIDLALINEARYPGLIDRSPSAQEVQAALERALAQSGLHDGIGVPFEPSTLLDVLPNLVLFDDRFHNIASETARGVDFALQGAEQTSLGTLSFDFLASYYLKFERSITAAAPVLGQLNSPGKPVDFRLRASVGLSRNAIDLFVHINYVDDYRNPLVAPPVSVDSSTTADLTLRLDPSQLSEHSWLSGLTTTLSVRNLLDEPPPELLGDDFGLAYDSANADARGRFVSLEITKQW